MTGRNTSPITTAGVVGMIKHVWMLRSKYSRVIARFVVLVAHLVTFTKSDPKVKHVEDTSASIYRASNDDRPQYSTHNSNSCRGHH